MTPLRAEHADYTQPISGAPRFQIRRVLTGYAYPNHGNLHNPTPIYHWHLLLDDRLVDMAEKRGILVSAARQPGAAGRYADREALMPSILTSAEDAERGDIVRDCDGNLWCRQETGHDKFTLVFLFAGACDANALIDNDQDQLVVEPAWLDGYHPLTLVARGGYAVPEGGGR